MIRFFGKYFFALFLILSFLSYTGCSLILEEMLLANPPVEPQDPDDQDPEEEDEIPPASFTVITVNDGSFTLAWDPDEGTLDYRLFYKVYESEDVYLLRDVSFAEEDDIAILLDSSDFTDGGYIIMGVASINNDGSYSNIHFSTDETAMPSAGWVLEFI